MTEHTPAAAAHGPRRVQFGPDTAWAETHTLGGQDITHFQVLGERSSGTNYLETLLARNLTIRPRAQFQWKHGYPITHIIPRTHLTIVSFRDPLDWLRSMHKKPWHTAADFWQMSFSDFLRRPWRSEVDDWIIRDDLRELRRQENPLRYAAARVWNHFVRPRFHVHRGWVAPSDKVKDAMFGLPVQHDLDPVDGTPFANILHLRNAKTRGYLSLRNRGCNFVFVRFEEVRANPEAFLQMLQQEFGLQPAGPFTPVQKWLGTLPENQTRQTGESPEAISTDDLGFIRDTLDPNLEAQVGYSLPPPGASEM